MGFPSRISSLRTSLLASAGLLLGCSLAVKAFQGMATSTRPARTVDIRTSLPPIKVDFRDVAVEAGLDSDTVRWDTGCSFFDYDLDGRLDLVVTGYVEFDRTKIPEPGASSNCQWKGMPVMCGPRGLPPGRNLLFHNRGN